MSTDLDAEIARMLEELRGAPEFLPSAFWEDANARNLAMLHAEGLARFKRTVSQNYFNWLITSVHHPFFRHLAWRLLKAPGCWASILRPLLTWPERRIVLRLMTQDAPVVLSARQRWVYAWFVALVWETMRRHDRLGLAGRLQEPLIGAPIAIRQAGRLISQDLANSIAEYNTFAPFLRAAAGRPAGRPLIGEIGAGYGRLAHVAAMAGTARYAIFDIPPALAVAQWYLGQVLPGRRIFRFRPFDDLAAQQAELDAADVMLFTANQLRHFPDGAFDLMLTISTLPEMRPDQARMYLDEMARLAAGGVFIKQWVDWTNPEDGTRLAPADYTLGPEWEVALDQPDPITPAFFNRLWRRRAQPSVA